MRKDARQNQSVKNTPTNSINNLNIPLEDTTGTTNF
jgi:hypothetical protein